ncbi:MAG: hypothetical protein JWO42_1384 [Chloroflexi bacterium]|nr:hypothetical protein [Chloroflexota bacterium]
MYCRLSRRPWPGAMGFQGIKQGPPALEALVCGCGPRTANTADIKRPPVVTGGLGARAVEARAVQMRAHAAGGTCALCDASMLKQEQYRCLLKAARPLEHGSAATITGLPLPASCPGGLPGALLSLAHGRRYLEVSFALRCFQRFSVPDLATGRCPWQDSPRTSGPSTPVLSY